MKISVIGCGYVGLVTGSCLSEIGHEVVCTDNDGGKMQMLAGGKVPIYEPGLDMVMEKNAQGGAAFLCHEPRKSRDRQRCDLHLRGDAAVAERRLGPERD